MLYGRGAALELSEYCVSRFRWLAIPFTCACPFKPGKSLLYSGKLEMRIHM